MSFRIITVEVTECTCDRCGAVWTASVTLPVRCATCRSPYWNEPRKRKPKRPAAPGAGLMKAKEKTSGN